MEQQQQAEKEVIPLSEVARMMCIDHETARRWAVEGKIPAFQYNDRGHWRAYRHEIDEWIEKRKNPPATGQVDSATQ